MDYNIIKNKLQTLYERYGKICDKIELIVDEPATEAEILQMEQEIGMRLPKELREFFLCFSKNCSLFAFLPEELTLPEELNEIFSANLAISIEEVINAEDCRINWVESCFPNIEDAYDKVWHHKLGIMSVGNGDVIALDLSGNVENPPVVYLSHDDGEGHGYVLGKTFNQFIQSYVGTGCCGNEDWQIIPFCEDAESGINPNCDNAVVYRKILKLDVL